MAKPKNGDKIGFNTGTGFSPGEITHVWPDGTVDIVHGDKQLPVPSVHLCLPDEYVEVGQCQPQKPAKKKKAKAKKED